MQDFDMLLKVKLHGLGVSPDGQGFVVLLLSERVNRVLPIIIGHFEAQAIVMELEKATIHRPLTHDLFKNSLMSANIRISRVVIDQIKNSTYFAKLYMRNNVQEWFVDARPSDSICMALKANSPIYVATDLMNECGQIIEFSQGRPVSDLEKLKRELENAVADEDFEKAAKIRDEIRLKFGEIKRKIKEDESN